MKFTPVQMLILLLILLPGLSSLARDKADSQETDAFDIGYNLTVSVSVVQVTACVRDRFGLTVHDLSKDDFVIRENGKKQEIVEFANARGYPKRVLVLLDVSGSMRIQDKIGAAKRGLNILIDTLKPTDELALVFFADGAIEIASNFTVDKEAVRKKLNTVHAYGKTALMDAVKAAPFLAKVDNKFQRAMVLVTDGFDNASESTVQQALSSTRKVDLPIYAYGFDPYPGRKIRPYETRHKAIEALTILSEQSGGRFTLVGRLNEMLGGLNQMNRDLENQYLLAFISKEVSRDNHHVIEVKCKKGYDVRARKGFYAE